MRKIYTLFFACIFAVAAIGQETILKLPAGCQFGIDGVVDDFWADVDAYNIELNFQSELPTLDLCTWQAVWNDTVIIVLVTTEEDNYCPAWCSGAADWQSDKPEIYFDVNVGALDDGVGPSAAPNGHYQIAPPPSQTAIDTVSGLTSGQGPSWFYFGYVIDDPDETWEFATMIDSLYSSDLVTALDPSAAPVIGFGATFIDRDEGDTDRKRAVWQNIGTVDESWVTMDECGEITFSTDEVECAGSGISTRKVSNFSVYPNPAMDYLQIDAEFNEVVITKIIGQEALILRDVKGTRIDISGLESGLYFIALYNNSKYIGTAKFTIK